jgi:hypothetical protein
VLGKFRIDWVAEAEWRSKRVVSLKVNSAACSPERLDRKLSAARGKRAADCQTGTREIGATIYIYHPAHWTAVHPHPKLYPRVFFESATDFDRALRRRFRAAVKDQRHPVTGGNLNQSASRFCAATFFRAADDLVEGVNQSPLLVNRKPGVAGNVDEQDVGDLELDFFLNFGGHSLPSLAIVCEQSIHCYSIGREQSRLFILRRQ